MNDGRIYASVWPLMIVFALLGVIWVMTPDEGSSTSIPLPPGAEEQLAKSLFGNLIEDAMKKANTVNVSIEEGAEDAPTSASAAAGASRDAGKMIPALRGEISDTGRRQLRATLASLEYRNGLSFDLGAYDYIAIYYSAGWCPPCRGFAPRLAILYDSMYRPGDKVFEVVMVSADRSGSDALEYMEEYGMRWPAVLPEFREGHILDGHSGGNSIPALTIVDNQGKIVDSSWAQNGTYRGCDVVLARFEKLIKEAKAKRGLQ